MIPNDIIEKFLIDVNLCRSVDCVLVKLSTAIYEIEDLTRSPLTSENAIELVHYFLYLESVQKILANLNSYKDFIEEKIYSDVRFKNLRKYGNIILNAIDNASRHHVGTLQLNRIKRPSIWYIDDKYSYKSTISVENEYYEGKTTNYRTTYDYPYVSKDEEYEKQRIDLFSGKKSRSLNELEMKSKTLKNKSKYANRKIIVMTIITAIIIGFVFVPYLEFSSENKMPFSIIDLLFGSHKRTTSITTRYTPYSIPPRYSRINYTRSYTSPSSILLKTTTTVEGQTYAPKVTYVKALTIGSTSISLRDDKLVIEYKGRWLPYLWLDVGAHTIHLTPYIIDDPDAIVADYLFVNSTYSKVVYSLDKLMSHISKYYARDTTIKLDINVESKICYMKLLENKSLVFTSCKPATFIAFPTLSGRSLFDVIIYNINSSTIQYLRDHLINKLGALSSIELAWKLLEWLDKNAEYDYSKSMLAFIKDVYTPIEFFNKKKGICSDYAVFTATALLSDKFEEAYIVIFDTENGSHAVAGIEINNTFYVLDQKLPIYEWADYVEYVFKPIGELMQVLKISIDKYGKSCLEVKTIGPSDFLNKYPDTYPSDNIPVSLIHESMIILSKRLGFVYTSSCYYKQYYWWKLLNWKPLKAYTPLFHRQFAIFLANVIEDELYDVLASARCVWSEARGDTLYIYIG